MDPLRGPAPCAFKLRDLILHQRDEGADYERGATAREAGELIAEQDLARTGRHDQKDVAPLGVPSFGRPLPGRGEKASNPNDARKRLTSRVRANAEP